MSQSIAEHKTTASAEPLVSAGELLPYALFTVIVTMVLIYFVGAEEGATSVISGSTIHEFVHDARHLLGFPCH